MLLNLEDLQLKIGEDSFILRRFERTDWKKIASVNLEQLKASSADWRVIEDNIGNVLYCHVESEFERKSLDANLVKMFQLSQVVVSYLLHIRQLAFAELSSLKQQLKATKKQLESAVKDKDEALKKLKELKKSVKNQQKLASSATATDYYKCPWCSKAFLNRDYLASHLQRRHNQHNVSSPVQGSVSTHSSAVAAAASSGGSGELLLDELKTRLQVAEKQLTEEKLLLHTIINKMDESNVSLQSVVVQEVQKMRETLLKAEAVTSEGVQTNRAEQESPVETVMVETVCAATATPGEPNDADSTSVPHRVASVAVDVQHHQQHSTQEETVSAVEASPQSHKKKKKTKKKISANSRHSGSSSEDEEEEDKKGMPSMPTSIDRRVLMERFRSTMKAALEQRMQRLIASSTVKENNGSSKKKKENKKRLTADEARKAIGALHSATATTLDTAEYRRMRRLVEAQMNQRLAADCSNKTEPYHKMKSSGNKSCSSRKKDKKTITKLWCPPTDDFVNKSTPSTETMTENPSSNPNRQPLITVRSGSQYQPPSTAAAAVVSPILSSPAARAHSSPVQQQQQRAPVPTPRLARGTTLTMTTKTVASMPAMELIDGDDADRDKKNKGGGSNALMLSKEDEKEELLMARDGEAMTTSGNGSGGVQVMMKSTIDELRMVASTAAVPSTTAATVSGAIEPLNSSNGKPTPPSPPVRSPFTQLTTTTAATVTAAKEEDTDDSFSLSSLDAILSELKRPGNKFGVVLPSSTAAAASAAPKTVQWRIPVVESEQEKPPLDESWDS